MDSPGWGNPNPVVRQMTNGRLGQIELNLPAEAEQIPIVRMLTHGVVARADFGLDAISDAKMAVDEACAQLVRPADPGATLCCVFREMPDGISVSISIQTPLPYAPSENSFGWHVLTTLARSVSARCDPLPGNGGGTTTIDLVLDPGTSTG
jgi:serine/threonine-protein kinase RsbW